MPLPVPQICFKRMGVVAQSQTEEYTQYVRRIQRKAIGCMPILPTIPAREPRSGGLALVLILLPRIHRQTDRIAVMPVDNHRFFPLQSSLVVIAITRRSHKAAPQD